MDFILRLALAKLDFSCISHPCHQFINQEGSSSCVNSVDTIPELSLNGLAYHICPLTRTYLLSSKAEVSGLEHAAPL